MFSNVNCLEKKIGSCVKFNVGWSIQLNSMNIRLDSNELWLRVYGPKFGDYYI